MNRLTIANRIGANYNTSNLETGEWSYVQDAGTKGKLVEALGYTPEHFKLDMRFVDAEYVVLVETKAEFVDSDAILTTRLSASWLIRTMTRFAFGSLR